MVKVLTELDKKHLAIFQAKDLSKYKLYCMCIWNCVPALPPPLSFPPSAKRPKGEKKKKRQYNLKLSEFRQTHVNYFD